MDKNTLSIFGWAAIAIIIVSILITAAPNFGTVVDDLSYKTFSSYRERAEISNKKHLISVENSIYGDIEFSTRETLKNGIVVYSAKSGEKVTFEVNSQDNYEFNRIELEYLEREVKKDESGNALSDERGELIYEKDESGNAKLIKRNITIKSSDEHSFIMPDAPVKVKLVFDYVG